MEQREEISTISEGEISWHKPIFYFIVFTIAGLSTILRPSISSNITLFRVILPLLGLYLLLNRPESSIKLFAKIIVLFAYSYFVSIYVSRFHYFDIVFFLHYSIILMFYLLVKTAVEEIGKEKLFDYIYMLYKVMLILAVFQLIFGGTYFNNQPRAVPNIFFWNENEFSAVLSIIIPLIFIKVKRGWMKFFWISLGVFFIIVSDARLSLIAVILFFLIFYTKKIPLFKTGYLAVLGAIVIIGGMFLYFKDDPFLGGISLGELVLIPFNHILRLEPIPNIGSIGPRTNAFIYGFQELKNTSLLGIGPGNANTLMQENIIPGMEVWSAKSMHNIILQTITELGYLGIAFICWFFFRIMKSIKNNEKYDKTVLAFFFVSSLIGITMLSGAFNNYYFLFVLFYAIFYFDDKFPPVKEKVDELE